MGNKIKLTPYEAIMSKRELYTLHHIASAHDISTKDKKYANDVYLTVNKYDEESVETFLDRYKSTLLEYVRHDVKKYFGITIDEYLNLTYKEKMVMLEICQEEAKRALEMAEAAKKNSDAEINKLKTSMQTKPLAIPKPTTQPNSSLAGFDFNELYDS